MSPILTVTHFREIVSCNKNLCYFYRFIGADMNAKKHLKKSELVM